MEYDGKDQSYQKCKCVKELRERKPHIPSYTTTPFTIGKQIFLYWFISVYIVSTPSHTAAWKGTKNLARRLTIYKMWHM